jgi:hypothetical protein
VPELWTLGHTAIMKAFILFAIVAALVCPIHSDAEGLALTALKMRLEYRPENRWGPVFAASGSASAADRNNATQVLLAKDGKSKSVMIVGSVIPKDSSHFDKALLTRLEGQATTKDYRLLSKEFTTFAGMRAYRLASVSLVLKRQLLLYCFYSGDMEYAIIAGTSGSAPIQSDTEIKGILDSIELTK